MLSLRDVTESLTSVWWIQMVGLQATAAGRATSSAVTSNWLQTATTSSQSRHATAINHELSVDSLVLQYDAFSRSQRCLNILSRSLMSLIAINHSCGSMRSSQHHHFCWFSSLNLHRTASATQQLLSLTSFDWYFRRWRYKGYYTAFPRGCIKCCTPSVPCLRFCRNRKAVETSN